MTHQPETARELLHRHGLPEDIIDGALCLHAQELAALQRLRMDELDLTGQKARIVGRIVDLIDPTRTPAAVSAAVAPPTNQAALRDRIAQALAREDAHNAGYDHGFVGSYGADDETDGFVDAVLAVLPSADRAAVLREAADELGRMDFDTDSTDYGYDTYRDAWNGGVMDAAEELRRMADETPAAACGRPASMATPCSAGDHCCKGPAGEAHVVADGSDDLEHVDDCPGCEAFTLTGHVAAPQDGARPSV
jgi:hypothetical protein